MSLIEFVIKYGYAAIFIGAFFEGETFLILGGLASHEGVLNMYAVMIVAFFGAIFGDWIYFFLGRMYGEEIMNKWLKAQKFFSKGQDLVGCNAKKISFSFRFFYGFRMLIPFSLGMTSIKTRDFLILNSLGALLWVLVMGSLGYLAGELLSTFLGGVKKYELSIIIATVIVFSVFNFLSRHIRTAYKKKKMDCKPKKSIVKS